MSETKGERSDDVRELRQREREQDTAIAELKQACALMQEKHATTEKRVDELCREQNNFLRREDWSPEKYVTQKEWEPVKLIAYGAVGTILLAVLGALISLILVTRS